MPDKRPQHVLELAWALQEAQRLAGMDVSEPVVLDGLGGAGAGDLRTVGVAGAAALGGAVPTSAPGGGAGDGLGVIGGLDIHVDDQPGRAGVDAEAVPGVDRGPRPARARRPRPATR